ncbi:MAG: dTMP kinase [Actinomycetota bacterium]|nr:dTMP kinase [Actinomycetota bacterium]
MTARGVLITLEGGEGCGKSTQLRLLSDRLRAAGFTVTIVREPGGTAVGEAVRSILLDRDHEGLDYLAELLLYEASRAQLVAQVIRPALASAGIVICDRFADSSTAYQGYGRDLPLDEVRALNRAATGGLVPDLTIVLDVPPEVGLARASRESQPDRLEAESVAFHERVREGFLEIAAAEPERTVVVDASGSVADVAALVSKAVRSIPVIGVVFGGTDE